MRIARHRTIAGKSPLEGLELMPCALGCGETGTALEIKVPAGWSHAAALRFWELACIKALPVARGVKRRDPVNESIAQAIERISGALAYEGWELGYFDQEADSLAFAAEIARLLADQVLTFGPNALGRFGAGWAHGWKPGAAVPSQICDPRLATVRLASLEESCNLEAIAIAAHADPLDTAMHARAARAMGADLSFDLGPARDLTATLELLELAEREPAGLHAPRTTHHLPSDRSDAMEAYSWLLARDRDLAAMSTGRAVLDWAENALADALTGEEADRWRALTNCRDAGLAPQVMHRLLDQQMLASSLDPESDTPDPDAPLLRGAGLGGLRLGLVLEEGGEAPDWWLDAAWLTGHGEINRADRHGRVPAMDGSLRLMPGSGVALAALSAQSFLGADGRIDTAGLAHAVRLATIAAEILSSRSAMPDAASARIQFEERPIGICLVGVGSSLMAQGLAQDSVAGRDLAATLAALVDANAWATLAEMAAEHGAAPAADERRVALCEGLRLAAVHASNLGHPAGRLAVSTYKAALREARANGLRSVSAGMAPPIGDFAVLLDADSVAFDPPAAIVRFRRAPGGGYYKTLDRAALQGLARLGYGAAEIDGLMRYAVGHGTLARSPGVHHDRLRARGLNDAQIARLEAVLPGMFDIRHAFTPWALGEEALEALLGSRAVEAVMDPGFDLLRVLGFREGEIEAANLYCCGAHGLAGGPGLDLVHEAVFAVGAASGRHTDSVVGPQARLAMARAVEPYLSGSMAGLLDLPADAERDVFAALASEVGEAGLRGVVLRRDGASLAYPALPLQFDGEEAEGTRPDVARVCETSPSIPVAGEDMAETALLRRALQAACAAALAAGVAPEILVQVAGSEARAEMADSLAELARSWMADRLSTVEPESSGRKGGRGLSATAFGRRDGTAIRSQGGVPPAE